MVYVKSEDREARELYAEEIPRIEPDPDLHEKAKELWWSTVRAFRPTYFSESERTLLRSYVQTYAQILELEPLLADISDHFETDRYGQVKVSAAAIRMEQLQRTFLAIARSLRLTPQSRLAPPTSSKDDMRAPADKPTTNSAGISKLTLLPGRSAS